MADPTVADPTTAGNRFFRITDEDHRGSILIVTIICATYLPVVLAIRVVLTSRNFGPDDYLSILATIIGVLQYILVWVSVSLGLGRDYNDVDSSDGSTIGKLYITSLIFYLITVFLTKCCVIYLCRRLFSANMKRQKYLCDAVLAISGIWCIGSLLTATISCGSTAQIGYHVPFCHDETGRWIGIGATDAITEVLIFILAVIVVIPLQMTTNRKLGVLGAFVPRLGTIALVSLHAHYMDKMVHSSRPSISLVTPLIYRQVHILLAIVSAAIPGLNRGLRKFHTSMGGTWMSTQLSQPRSSDRHAGTGGSFPLKSLGKSQGSNIRSENRSQNRSQRRSLETDTSVVPARDEDTFRADNGQYSTATYWGKGKPDEVDARSGQSQESHNSEAKIIRKHVDWQVHYEE